MDDGMDKIQQLQQAGFSTDEINQWESGKRAELSQAGFAQGEIDKYFGYPQPDMGAAKSHFDTTIKQLTADAARVGIPAIGSSVSDVLEAMWGLSKPAAKEAPHEAQGAGEAFQSGMQNSVLGLRARMQDPNVVLSRDAPWYDRAAAAAGQMVGDAPYMALGGLVGSLGGPASATGGAFALPAALREALVQEIRKGNVRDSRDFLDRALAVSYEGAKGYVTGVATASAGLATAAYAKGLSPVIRATMPTLAEITTMATVSRGVEGELPQPHDFVDAAVLMAGLKSGEAVVGKLQGVYAKTGRTPAQVVQDAQMDPTIKQDLVSSNKPIPDAYAPLAPKAPEQAANAPTPPEPPVRSEAETQVLGRIAKDTPQAKALTWDQFYTATIDDLHPLAELTKALAEGKDVPVTMDPYKLARLTRGSFGRADQFIENSPFEFNTYKNVGKPLKDVLAPVAQDLDGFRAYAVAKRALELDKRGIETGVPIDAARATVKTGGAKFEKTMADLQGYQGHLLSYLKDSGILSADAHKAMVEANKDYVPFYRLMGDEMGGSGAGTGLRVKNPIKAIKGSERLIVDPIESVIKNTYAYITLAERNAVGRAMVELAGKSENGAQYVEKVPTPMRPIEVTEPEVAKFLQEHGINADPEAFTVFRPNSGLLKADEVAVYRNGKREVYRVDPEVAKAFSATDRQSATLLTRILAQPASLLRAGSVLSPEFMARNLARDQLSAFILSENGFTPFIDILRGLGSLINKDGTYEAWLKGGGANSALVAVDRAYIEQNIMKLEHDTGFLSRVVNVAKSPIEFLRIASELTENATRLGEFKRAMGGSTTKEATLNAALASRDVTLDFAKVGAKTRAMNMITAFWQAHINGLDRVRLAFTENPTGTLAKVAASITLPSVLLWWANHDDPRWKDVPQWQKDLFWIVMTKDHIYRIPKPFELGVVFGSLPERLAEKFFTDNPNALKNFDQTIAQSIPDVIPTFAVPPLEQWANKSQFTGAPLIPSHLEGVLPQYQYMPYTTELSKAIGAAIGSLPGSVDKILARPAQGDLGALATHEALGFAPDLHTSQAASPLIIDNYIRGWTGGLGQYVLRGLDAGLRKAGVLPDPPTPAWTLADVPFVKAFVIRYPSANAQSIKDFYDNYGEVRQLQNTVQMLQKQGNVEAIRKEIALNPGAMVKLDNVRQSLSHASQAVQMVYQNPDMTPDDKRQLIDTIYFQMIEMAKAGNATADAAKKSLGSNVENSALH